MGANTNPVTWFEIYVDDLARAKQFYETVFACTLVPEQTDGSFEALRFPGAMPGSGAMGALMKHPMRKPSLEGTMVYFHCDDCDQKLRLAQENGGQIFRSKWSIGDDGYIAIIGDTEGNAIGLHSFQ
jgi:predicted enzyme related to lactoylglutathione lyase